MLDGSRSGGAGVVEQIWTVELRLRVTVAGGGRKWWNGWMT